MQEWIGTSAGALFDSVEDARLQGVSQSAPKAERQRLGKRPLCVGGHAPHRTTRSGQAARLGAGRLRLPAMRGVGALASTWVPPRVAAILHVAWRGGNPARRSGGGMPRCASWPASGKGVGKSGDAVLTPACVEQSFWAGRCRSLEAEVCGILRFVVRICGASSEARFMSWVVGCVKHNSMIRLQVTGNSIALTSMIRVS